MAKKPSKDKRDPVNYLVLVNVDKHGKFTYHLPDGSDASTLRPFNRDTVKWSLKVKEKQQPFSIEFPDYGPFGIHNRVARSFGGPTAELTVNVSPFYRGNLAMKYNVILTNGWSDDPDVVPIPSDGLDPQIQVVNPPILLSVDATGLVISPPRSPIYAGIVTWKWQDGVDESNRDDFDLKFDPMVSGWPATASSNGTQQILLNLPAAGANNPYTITTENLGLKAAGTLTVL
uniref:Uncharacterized protein n=1 Tax=Solibacter usitatus (strain Ellin6076) TaxID=234267 RepID=Q01PY0_SOLUE